MSSVDSLLSFCLISYYLHLLWACQMPYLICFVLSSDIICNNFWLLVFSPFMPIDQLWETSEFLEDFVDLSFHVSGFYLFWGFWIDLMGSFVSCMESSLVNVSFLVFWVWLSIGLCLCSRILPLQFTWELSLQYIWSSTHFSRRGSQDY